MTIGGSYNGSTPAFEAENHGSNPCPPTIASNSSIHAKVKLKYFMILYLHILISLCDCQN